MSGKRSARSSKTLRKKAIDTKTFDLSTQVTMPGRPACLRDRASSNALSKSFSQVAGDDHCIACLAVFDHHTLAARCEQAFGRLADHQQVDLLGSRILEGTRRVWEAPRRPQAGEKPKLPAHPQVR